MRDFGIGIIVLSIGIGMILGLIWLYQPLRVYMAETYTKTIVLEKEYLGKANLLQAENERKILIEQALAEKESATYRAEAIEIVGAMAKKYPEYRQQEYIGAFAEALKEGNINQIMYIPTEAGIPIMEASRLQKGN